MRAPADPAHWDCVGPPEPVGTTAFGELLFPEVSLRFGTLTLRFRSPNAESVFAVADSYTPFLVAPSLSEPSCDFLCLLGDPVAGAGAPAFASGGPWDQRVASNGVEQIVFHFGREERFIGLALTFDPSFRHGTIVERELAHTVKSPATFSDHRWGPRVIRVTTSPFVEYMVARLIPRHGGLHLHASLALKNEGAYVFVGHSGAGKSTVASLAEQAGAFVPADDRTLITSVEDVPKAWGTPWHGDLPRKSPAGGPVRAVFVLQQDSRNYVEPLTPQRAVKELYTRLVQPAVSALEVSLSLQHLEHLLTAVPVAVLHFRPTVDAVRLAIETYP